MKKLLFLASLLVTVLVNTSFAADHKDGAGVQIDPATDITDVFAFPRNDNSGSKRLTLIMSTRPDAAPDTLFSNAINYRFRLRPVTGFQHEPFKAMVADEEFRIDCRVTGNSLQTLSCKLLHIADDGTTSTVLSTATVNTRDPSGGDNPDMKIFAGSRADQLFTDRARVRMPVWRDTGYSGPEWPGVNTFLTKNVLSIVVDIDVQKLLQVDTNLLAFAGETAIISAANAKVLQRIDRMGRVEITVFFIDVIEDRNIRDLWNRADSFAVNPEILSILRAELQRGLKRMDAFELSQTGENVLDWAEPHPWLELLLDDFLILDLDYPTRPSSTAVNYLGVESAYFNGVPSKSVGGRLPNENVIEKTLTFFINGMERNEPNRGVGVDEPAIYTVDTFPFVPPAHEVSAEGTGQYE